MERLHFDEVVELMRQEYTRNPELALTFWQAQRLWNLSEAQCVHALRVLIEAGFLSRTRDGCYRRALSVGRRVRSRRTDSAA